ncbi:sporulation integral membrane protein YtvI [Halobacteroides halobius DSM 5150]|uniref:Sporulation integral membrane protein YtvI n=1 Tax=Halobacteroides halobius (strain ATCC 35273 / DSM 5150 / MD-1) TaxID=748449 RepID=L0K8G7_HALHC|nr:sporulation integral membrane protein YtvI [Halobacteroides halobius]AGB40664.1 sporulation integral membrane protein YtvI [Halobacteroides halobius DSM 5150]
MKTTYKLVLFFLLLILASLLFLNYVVAYLLPFVIAIIVASLIEPVVNFLQQEGKLSRGLAVAIVLIIIIILISLLLAICFSRLFVELDNLVNNLPDYQTIGNKFHWLAKQNKELSELMEEWQLSDSIKKAINSNLQKIYDRIKKMIQLVITSLLEIVKQLPRLVTILLISLIATFFISRDKKLILKTLLSPFPKYWRKKILQVQVEIISAGVGFIRAQMILISITTILSIIGLITLQSDYALVAGLAAGTLDLIPIIGPGMVYTPWIIYNLVINNLHFALGLLIIYIIVTITRQVAEAKIVGESIGVHPLATLVSMYLGVQLFGATGFFIGPALVIILKAIINTGFISLIIND